MAGGPEREEEELCHLKTSSDEPHSHMLGMVVVDSPSATPHCPQRQSVEAQTGLFAVGFAYAICIKFRIQQPRKRELVPGNGDA